MQLRVRKCDPQQMEPHRIILFIGKRGTGKSKLLADIMYHIHDKVDFGLAMTPTEESAAVFRETMPEAWIYNSFSSSKLDAMLSIQRGLGKKGKQRDLFVVMDDCMYDKKVMKGTSIRDLFMNGRHLKVTFCNAVQYIMDMGPDLRTQVDYVFALRENIISNKIKLHRYFFGMFDKSEDFTRVLDRCTENFSCLVLDNTVPTTRMEDCVFWYRADVELPPFKMGKPLYWKLAERTSKTAGDREREELEQARARQAPLAQSKGARISFVTRQNEAGETIKEDACEVLTLN